jgi:hypothetical protein
VDQDVLQKVALDLLRDAQRAQSLEIAKRSADVVRPEYWTGLCPDLTIGRKPTFERPEKLPRIDPEAFRRDGYFIQPAVLPAAQTRPLATAIERLRTEGWPPLFAFVFDEFWGVAWTTVRGLVTSLLGPGPLLIPNVAVHYVEAGGSQGWTPHIDGKSFDNRLTSWIPLTDATLTNGCIYVVPRSGDVEEAVTRFGKAETTHADAVSLLQHARALPAAAGSVLGWAFDVLHWGSVNLTAPAPRVSVAYEWLGRDASPEEHELPLIDLDEGLPPLPERLDQVARSILSYYRFDSGLLPFEELAKQLRISAPAGR